MLAPREQKTPLRDPFRTQSCAPDTILKAFVCACPLERRTQFFAFLVWLVTLLLGMGTSRRNPNKEIHLITGPAFYPSYSCPAHPFPPTTVIYVHNVEPLIGIAPTNSCIQTDRIGLPANTTSCEASETNRWIGRKIIVLHCPLDMW